jgi:hypothetical protein
MKSKELSYLATPYSKHPDGVFVAFRDACMIAGKLLLKGINVYSPIAHTHCIASFAEIDPFDHKIWLPFDEAMLDVSHTLIVAHMSGWDTSKGVAYEIEYFSKKRKPIFDLDPVHLVMTQR